MTTLTKIAEEMHHAARADLGQPVRRKLTGGLHLVLIYHLDRRQLSLVRDGSTPSLKEVDVCKRDFDIGTARIERSKQHVSNQTFHIVRLIYRAQMSLIEESDKGVMLVK